MSGHEDHAMRAQAQEPQRAQEPQARLQAQPAQRQAQPAQRA